MERSFTQSPAPVSGNFVRPAWQTVVELRSRRGWTQEKLAEKSILSVRTIQNLERGKSTHLGTIAKVAEALGVIEKLPRKQINRALASVAAFKSKMQPPTKFSDSAFRKLDDAVWKLRVAVLGEERAAERSPENAARSPVERY